MLNESNNEIIPYKSKQEENEDVNTPELPPEIWTQILSHVPPEQIARNVKNVSKNFHDISHENFINSLYGRFLRFNKWHDNEFKKLKKEIAGFSASFELGIFNLYPQDPTTNCITNCAFIFAILGPLSFIAPKLSNFDMLVQLLTNVTTENVLTFLTCIMAVVSVLIAIARHRRERTSNNTEYQRSHLTQSQLDELKKFINAHATFLSFSKLPIHKLNNNTIEELREALAASCSMLEIDSDALKSHLLNTTRFSTRQTLTQDEIPKDLKSYASTITNFWAETTKNKKIVEDDNENNMAPSRK